MIPYVTIYSSSCYHGNWLDQVRRCLHYWALPFFKNFHFFTHYWSTFQEGTNCQMKVVHCKIWRQTPLSWADREQMPWSHPDCNLGNQPSLFLIWKLDWLVSIFSSGKRTWWTPLEITPISNRWNPTTVKQLEIGLFRWNPI